MAMSGPFASATEIPILAVKKTLASDIKERCIRNCNLNVEACGKQKSWNQDTKRTQQFFLCTPTLNSIKKHGRIRRIFYIIIKKMVAELMFFNGTVKSISHLVSICRLLVLAHVMFLD